MAAKRKQIRYTDSNKKDKILLKNIAGDVEISKELVEKLMVGIVNPKQQAFLFNLAVLGSRTRAAKAAGISSVITWVWRQDNKLFQDAYDTAMKIAAEFHEDEMFRRASEGVLEPVFQGGQLVGSIRRFSDGLLQFALKGAMPTKYRDNVKVEHAGQVDVVQRLHRARERVLGRKK